VKVIQTTSCPSKAVATMYFKDSAEKPVTEVFEWFKNNIRGTIWWSKTQFYDASLAPNTRRHYSSRQKHFKDGYWMYYFYFALKADAAKFILFWGNHGK